MVLQEGLMCACVLKLRRGEACGSSRREKVVKGVCVNLEETKFLDAPRDGRMYGRGRSHFRYSSPQERAHKKLEPLKLGL